MIYPNIYPAVFQARPNRFIAHVLLNGEAVVCHVKNTGRCRELLIPGVPVFIQEAQNPARKTRFDLISVYKGERLINIDSQAPNRIFPNGRKRAILEICSNCARKPAMEIPGSIFISRGKAGKDLLKSKGSL